MNHPPTNEEAHRAELKARKSSLITLIPKHEVNINPIIWMP